MAPKANPATPPPGTPLTIQRDNGRIWSYLRHKWLHETPEERVRQEYLCVLVNEYGYTLGQMAEEMLMRGFTTVRDAGGASIGVQRAIDDGWFKGPRIFSSGAFLTQTSGHLDMHDRNEPHRHVGGGASRAEQIGHFATVDGADEVLAAVRENFRQGATQIKLATNGGVSAVYSPLDITQFTDEELETAVWAAGSFGSYVMAHVYYDDAVSRTIDAGARSIEHGHLMADSTAQKMAENDVFLVVEALMSSDQGFNAQFTQETISNVNSKQFTVSSEAVAYTR